jgi:hypothetical protein
MRRDGKRRQRWSLLDQREVKTTKDLVEQILHRWREHEGARSLRSFLATRRLRCMTVHDELMDKVAPHGSACIIAIPTSYVMQDRFDKSDPIRTLLNNEGVYTAGWTGYMIVLRSTRISSWLEDFAHEIGHLQLALMTGHLTWFNKHEEDFCEQFSMTLAMNQGFRLHARRLFIEMRKNNNVLKFSTHRG